MSTIIRPFLGMIILPGMPNVLSYSKRTEQENDSNAASKRKLKMIGVFNQQTQLKPVIGCLFLVGLLCLSGRVAGVRAQSASSASSPNNMVASVHPLATEAGIAAFEKGGNAIDAAIATALTLGVVDGYNSGIGGGCFILIRLSNGKVFAIDGREIAPAAATRDMYLRNGNPDISAPRTGAKAIAIPGALMAFEQVVSEHGELDFRDLILPAAEIAAQGFPISQLYSDRIRLQRDAIKRFPSTAAILFKDDGTIWLPNEVLIQKDLSDTYKQLADNGTDWFYNGPFAVKTEAWMKSNGGIATSEDFRSYRTVARQAVRTTYRGYEIIGFPPPSSGGVHVAQILNILENFDLQELRNQDEVQLKHVVVEAMKLAFADRAFWLGDPDYVNVPKQLISKQYAKELAARINLDAVTAVKSHGTPPNSDVEFFEKHTTHLCTADRDGNWVSITSTINTTFGSKVIIPGTGVIMNNQMDDFSIAPGVANSFGLVGSENNAIGPGKRPLSSMSPTIVLKDGTPIMTVGAAGGPKIITQVVWAIVNHLDFGMSIVDSIGEPKIHHQWSPDQVLVEQTVDLGLRSGLENRGHMLRQILSSHSGVAQAIIFDRQSGQFIGTHDPRVPGKARGTQ